MANEFLSAEYRDTETALMLERAIVHDIGKAVAYTDGNRVFLNTDDNLFNLLPAYNILMKKWLLWHERMHKELGHHARFFKYLKELEKIDGSLDKFHITHSEVNIIMDILVHDWMAPKFPELVPVAQANLAQFRNRNSLKYTFKTFTLEEMLTEYADYKKDEDTKDEDGKGEDTEDKEENEDTGKKKKSKKSTKDTPKEDSTSKSGKPGHGEGGDDEEETSGSPEESEPKEEGDKPAEPEPEHDKTDWSKLEDIDDKEFITKDEGAYIERTVAKLKRKKIRLAQITKTLNGLATSTRVRTYARPSTIHVGGGVLLKGTIPGKASLYLVFDASGSMSSEMQMFKDIIERSIPQAMNTPTEWFAGYGSAITPYKAERGNGYYKGAFKDFIHVHASSGFNDDGDRTLELCYNAEQKGFSPIGVTDGGGELSWAKEKLKKLKRTIIVCQSKWWSDEIKKINPTIQVIYVGDDDTD